MRDIDLRDKIYIWKKKNERLKTTLREKSIATKRIVKP